MITDIDGYVELIIPLEDTFELWSTLHPEAMGLLPQVVILALVVNDTDTIMEHLLDDFIRPVAGRCCCNSKFDGCFYCTEGRMIEADVRILASAVLYGKLQANVGKYTVGFTLEEVSGRWIDMHTIKLINHGGTRDDYITSIRPYYDS